MKEMKIPFELLKFEEQLGSGTHGSVQKVTYKDKKYAMKKLMFSNDYERKIQQGNNEITIKRENIYKECYIMKKLDSLNCVK